MGGGRVGEKKTKIMLYSTQLKLKLKLELSLAKIRVLYHLKLCLRKYSGLTYFVFGL